MSSAAPRPQEPLPNGPVSGPCIAYRPMGRHAASWSRRATIWWRGNSRQSTGWSASLRVLASQPRRFRWVKTRSPHTGWTTPAKAAFIFAFFGAHTALAEGFVLSFQSDGRLTSTTPQSGFAQTYVDGIGQRRPNPIVYSAPAEPSRPRAHPSRAIPRPEILAAIQETAQRYGGHNALRRAGLSVSDWQILFQANIEIESAYRPNARSSVGAIGLGQLMPATAAQLGVDPHDWQANLDGSARYLLMMLAQFGTPELALAAYNAGPDAVARYGSIPPYRETQNHVRRVMAVAQRLTGAS